MAQYKVGDAAKRLSAKKRDKLRRDVIEGCRDMATHYLEIEKEFHPLEEEVHRALDKQAPTRRRRPRTARSR